VSAPPPPRLLRRAPPSRQLAPATLRLHHCRHEGRLDVLILPDPRVDCHGHWTGPLTVVHLWPKTAAIDCSSLVSTSSPLPQIEFPSSSVCSSTSFSTTLRPWLARFGQCRHCRPCAMGAPLLQAVGCQPMSRPAGMPNVAHNAL
jgi:hypothetical protein